jgi:MFS family permease
VVLGCCVAAIVVSYFISAQTKQPPDLETGLVNVYGVSLLSFALLGVAIAKRRPGNRFGWLLSAIAFIHACGYLLAAVGNYLLFRDATPLPGAALFVWLFVWTATLHYGPTVTLIFLLFPDGRLPSPRWRPVAWLAFGWAIAGAIGVAIMPGPLPVFEFDNPYAVGGPLPFALAGAASSVVGIGCVTACVASLFWRYRRAGGVERQQLKWFLYGGAIAAIAVLFIVASGQAIAPAAKIVSAVTIAMTAAAAVAIFRYHLFDIDLLINRTLVYGLTTIGIAIAFFGGIVVLQSLLRPVTGGSEIAVAGSTLISFAFVGPFRRRAQAGVDRRFYRSRYDASRVLDRFVAELSGEVDLEAVRSGLIAAVAQTVQPAHASLWLRHSESRTVGG